MNRQFATIFRTEKEEGGSPTPRQIWRPIGGHGGPSREIVRKTSLSPAAGKRTTENATERETVITLQERNGKRKEAQVRRRQSDALAPPHSIKVILSAHGAAITSRKTRPASHLRPARRFQVKALIGPLVVARSGSGERVIVTRGKWESWKA